VNKRSISINSRRGNRGSDKNGIKLLVRRLPVVVVASTFGILLVPLVYSIRSVVEEVKDLNTNVQGESNSPNNEIDNTNVILYNHSTSGGLVGPDRTKRDEDIPVQTKTSGLRSRAKEAALDVTVTSDGLWFKDKPRVRAVSLGMATTLEEKSQVTSLSPIAPRRSSRFPRYGTPEFTEQCDWIMRATERTPSSTCTFFYAPSAVEHEGLSFWAAQVVSSYLLALQAGCRLIFSYGQHVSMEQVLLQPPATTTGSYPLATDALNWTADRCDDDINCFEIPHPKGGEVTRLGKTLTFEIPGRGLLAPVPRYRYAYIKDSFRRNENVTHDLELSLPGFDLEHGMACSLGALFHLSPAASRFEPGLFDEMLPVLRDEEALVMGIYIRTDWADMSRTQSKSLIVRNKGYVSPNGTLLTKGMKFFHGRSQRTLSSAISMEYKYLTGEFEPNRRFSKVVWMVSTDAPFIKEGIINSYDGKDVNTGISESKYPSQVIPRKVVTTGSEGRHTRFSELPSTTVFAEAFIDWFLLGESDLVITDEYSFADTAAMRTSRPVIKHGALSPFWAPPARRRK